MTLAEQYSLIPDTVKHKDPRNLLYFYPRMNKITLSKKLLKFSFYQTLKVAEDLANRQGCILVPWECMNWKRAKEFGADKKVKIGRNSFFMMKPGELTKSEKMKLERYLEELQEE